MSDLHDGSLRGLDLNVLVAFDALAEERSVTRAARRLGVTQSAMSHTLRRLRALLDDPVMVRTRGGMSLTPRAEALAGPLRTALLDIRRALDEPGAFVPATSRRTFRLTAPDLFELLMLPLLVARLAALAPDVDLALVPRPADLAGALEHGDIDLAVIPVLLDSAGDARLEVDDPHLRRRALFRDRFRTFYRPGHPELEGRRRVGRARFASLLHLLVSPTGAGTGLVDRALAEHGLRRRVALRTPHFASAPQIVLSSDLVLTAPASLEKAPGELCSIACPVPLPEHAVTMIWHERVHEDGAHRWLRERLVEVSASR